MEKPISHHSSCCEVRALLVLLAITQNSVKSPYAIRNEVMGFEKIEILVVSARTERSIRRGWTYVVVYANFNFFATLLLLFDKASG